MTPVGVADPQQLMVGARRLDPAENRRSYIAAANRKSERAKVALVAMRGDKTLAELAVITRLRADLRYAVRDARPVAAQPVNEGVLADERIALRGSRTPWQRIVFRTRRGRELAFLTNGFDLEPGLFAFLCSRHWEEEKCFDTWKNDFNQAKAWGASVVVASAR